MYSFFPSSLRRNCFGGSWWSCLHSAMLVALLWTDPCQGHVGWGQSAGELQGRVCGPSKVCTGPLVVGGLQLPQKIPAKARLEGECTNKNMRVGNLMLARFVLVSYGRKRSHLEKLLRLLGGGDSTEEFRVQCCYQDRWKVSVLCWFPHISVYLGWGWRGKQHLPALLFLEMCPKDPWPPQHMS